MRVAVLGLGEAGTVYATDLHARGVSVIGTDLHLSLVPSFVERADHVAAAVHDADVVLSLVGAGSAAPVLAEALLSMPPAAVYADMNTSGPEDKRAQAAAAAARGIPYVDVAIMAPVARARLETPLLLSGAGVGALAPILGALGIPATDVGGEAGAAARRKLLRSVFMKGLAAVVVESVEAAATFGEEEWLVEQISAELGASGRDAVDHLIAGTRRHAVRREAEMEQARALLQSLGVPHPMTDGTIRTLRAVAAEV